MLPLCSEMPVLLLGGAEDGVIVTSSTRYGVDAEPDTMMRRTFEEALTGERGDRYLAIILYAGECLAHRVGLCDICGGQQGTLEDQVLAELRLPETTFDTQAPFLRRRLEAMGLAPAPALA